MDEVAPQPEQVAKTAGQTLKAEREAQGKSLADIAGNLKISERLLDALERDAVSELPAGPYATGFARSYARALGLDPNPIVADIRAAQGAQPIDAGMSPSLYEPVDVSRVPSRALAWTAAAIALAMVVAYLVWKFMLMQPDVAAERPSGSETPAATTPASTAPATAPAAAPPPAIADDVVVRIAASSQVWFSLEDANGRSQFDLTLQGGEFYTLRPEQRGLLLRTGRPQALRILLGDDRLPQLGADDAVVSGVRLDTASLAQRLRAGATPAPAAPITPAINPNPPPPRPR